MVIRLLFNCYSNHNELYNADVSLKLTANALLNSLDSSAVVVESFIISRIALDMTYDTLINNL